MGNDKPKILIVGTVPYSTKATSRAFAAYFTGWPKEHLAQIFSSTKTPPKGHCMSLYQITDQRLLKARYSRKTETGRIFEYKDLPDEWKDNSREISSSFVTGLYNYGRRKRPMTMLLRGWLWNRKYWCSDKLNAWLDDFAPDCVFLSLSNDFFIQDIAVYAAERFDIPIVISIGDDYYFNYLKSFSPFYHIYKLSYRSAMRKVYQRCQRAVYISDKIKRKYEGAFGLKGETVYLTSEIERKPFQPVSLASPVISYFGNIKMGRNKSLNEIGTALGQISQGYVLDIYSNEADPAYSDIFKSNPNVRFHGSIPYSEVQVRTRESDIVVIVEGFAEKDISWSRYSLSTKAADALACGAQIFVYGSSDCGVIEYMASTDSAQVCTEKSGLEKSLRRLMEDTDLQKKYYENAVRITEEHHNLKSSTELFERLVEEAIREYGSEK